MQEMERGEAEPAPRTPSSTGAAAVASSDNANGSRGEDGPPPPSLSLILLLAGVTALGPFAMQAIAPALPTLSKSMAVSEGAAQSLISAAMLGIGLGSVVYGPLADHFGRRPVLLWGLVLSFLGALLACLAPAFGWVLLGRVAQAVGAGAGMVLARAAAQDQFGSRGATQAIAKMTAVMVLAPMFAPAIGGALTQLFGWRGIFGAVAVLSLGLYLWVYLRFVETAKQLSPTLDLSSAARDYRFVIARPAFRANTAFCAVQMMSFFIFVSGGPYVLERAYGVGPGVYGVMFVAAAVVYMIGNLSASAIADRVGHQGALRLAAMIAGFGCSLAALALWLLAGGPRGAGEVDLWGAFFMLVGLVFHATAAGIATPLSVAGAVAAYPERAGSASSLVGVAQFTAGAVAAQAAGFLPLDRGAPLMLSMAALCVCAYLSFIAFRSGAEIEHP